MKRVFAGLLCLSVLCSHGSGQEAHLVVQRGPPGDADQVRFSPDGKMLAVVSSSGTVDLREVPTGTLLCAISGLRRPADVAFSPSGGRLAVLSEYPLMIEFRDTVTGRSEQIVEPFDALTGCMAYSPDGRLLAVGAGIGVGGVRILSAHDGQLVRELEVPRLKTPTSLAFGPEGKRLATGFDDGTLELWDVGTGTLVRTLDGVAGHTEGVTSLSFSADGRLLASGSRDTTVRVWDADTGYLRTRLEGHESWVMTVALSPDGKRLASGDNDGIVVVWDIQKRSPVRSIEGGSSGVAISPDGKLLATVSRDGVQLWDNESDRLVRLMQAQGHRVLRLAADRGGRAFASGSADGSIRVWPLGARKTEISGLLDTGMRWMSALALSADAHRVAAGNADAYGVWSVPGGEPLANDFVAQWVSWVCISPDGRLYAVDPQGESLSIRGVDTGAATIIRYRGATTSAAFSPDGRHLVTGSSDGKVRMWEVSTGEMALLLLGHEESVNAMAVCPDESTIASGSDDGMVILWDVATGEQLHLFDATESRGGGIGLLSFSPDGRILASVADQDGEGELRLWDTETGAPLEVSHVFPRGVRSAVFGPGSDLLVTVADAGDIELWKLPAGEHLTLSLVGESDWVLWNDRGQFDCSAGAKEYVTFVRDSSVEPADKYWNTFYAPGLFGSLASPGGR